MEGSASVPPASHSRIRGLGLHSAFQPIYGLAHSKVVGHEALVRGSLDGKNVIGPGEVFSHLERELSAPEIEQLCTAVHLDSFRTQSRGGWLFLNLAPRALSDGGASVDAFRQLLLAAGLPPHRIVIEVIESAACDEDTLASAVEGFRSLGCLVAIDDFGAGESNFERVWRLRPDLVKLDRAMLVEAGRNRLVRHVLPGLVSLIHEAGCLVVLEGIETDEQALIAMESDVDFVQGFRFARPSAELPDDNACDGVFEQLAVLSRQSIERRSRQDQDYLQFYTSPFQQTARALQAVSELSLVGSSFLALGGVQRLYLVDEKGMQIGQNLESPLSGAPDRRFDPCSDALGANWFRRPYFQRAIQKPGTLQVSRPYLSIRDARRCVTLSMAMNTPKGQRILCADIDYDDDKQGYPRRVSLAPPSYGARWY